LTDNVLKENCSRSVELGPPTDSAYTNYLQRSSIYANISTTGPIK